MVPRLQHGVASAGFAPGSYAVGVQVRGFAFQWVAVEVSEEDLSDRTIEVRLQPGRRMEGEVANDSNEPVAGALVAVIPELPEWVSGDWASFFDEANAVRTGADGRFVLKCVPERACRIGVIHNYRPIEGTLTQPAEEMRITLRVPR